MIAPMAVGATSAFGGLFAARAVTVSLNMAPSKVLNDNPDDFATYLAKRKAAEEGREWVPEAGAPAAAAPAAAAPAAAAPAASSGTSKIKNENPDDFATYLAKRKAADAGRPNDWQQFM